MRRTLRTRHGAIVLCAVAFTAGCASSPSRPVAPPPQAPARCVGTLGLEVGPISRTLRKRLALPDFKGAVVTEVVAGGPAAAAGIRPNDVVVEIGSARLANECEFEDVGFNRSCEPVRVVLLRGGAILDTKLAPIDQDAFFEKSCRNGITGGCFRLAWSLWRHNQGTDRDRALELFQKACLAGSGEACAYEGMHLADRAGRSNDAIAVLELSCDLGNADGCANFAFLYATGTLVKRDDRRATSLYVKSCDLGNARGCYNVGLMADDARGGPRDGALAVARYEEACETGSSTACTNLGFLYENGRGVRQDGPRAAALYQRGCDGTRCQPSNLGGCVNLGRAYRDGKGVEKNESRAATIFQEACDRKLNPDDVDADRNRSRACSLLGSLYLAGDGIGKDVTKGRELSELGCARGDSWGCFNAASVYTSGSGVPVDAAKAVSFLEQACKGGDAEGCHDLGFAFEKGTGVARDRRRAVELFRRACELGFKPACAKKVR
jgi:TPR repeat protein